jgi:flagellar hook-basal body complex protein FliE
MNPVSATNLSPFLNTVGTDTTVQTPAAPSAAGTPGAAQAGAGANFMQSLTDAIGRLNGLQTNADQAVAGLALNQGVDIDQAMIAMEQASLGMHYAVQVRDKAVEAYQTLMNMQM